MYNKAYAISTFIQDDSFVTRYSWRRIAVEGREGGRGGGQARGAGATLQGAKYKTNHTSSS